MVVNTTSLELIERPVFKEMTSLVKAIADNPYLLTPDQWASEARLAMELDEKPCYCDGSTDDPVPDGIAQCPRHGNYPVLDHSISKNTLQLDLSDGTSARWVIPEDKVDDITKAIESVIGQPDTTKL